ncbi:hypothetical protein LCGC14_2456810 [marine sediment metagenome]|uniref:Uncharacterized protein n=1 Tax=marine sediment metagenome TaxID=412755 RepID=A0A0F9DRM8_9ZZZZ
MAKKTLEQHNQDVKRWGPRGMQMLQEAMEKVGAEVLGYARKKHLHRRMPRNVTGGPDGSSLGVVSSRLWDSLTTKTKVKGTEVITQVGTNVTHQGVSYPRLHEFGLGGMPERPWLRPSVRAKQDRLREEVKRAWVAAYGK